MWNILRGLPSHSHYVAAQKQDPELAEHLANLAGDEDRKWRPQPTEYTLQHELLAANFDRLGELIAAVINGYAKRGIQPPSRFPRPETELDRAMKRLEFRVDRELDDLIKAAHATYAAEHPPDSTTDP